MTRRHFLGCRFPRADLGIVRLGAGLYRLPAPILVLIEKVAPYGRQIAGVAGAVAIVAGIYVVAAN
jgi:hypothetical protein